RSVERCLALKSPVHIDHVLLGDAEALSMSLTWSGRKSPSSSTESLLLALRRLKKSFFWLMVVPIFPRDHERTMYSWIAALIHHMAQVASRNPFSGSKRLTACIRPTLPSEINSEIGKP